MLTVILVAAFVAVVVAVVAFYFVRKQALTVAADASATAVKETLRQGWPHPWVGRTVAYAYEPRKPIGEVTRIDGSGRARVKRYGKTSVRRSVSRLVLFGEAN